MIDTQLIAHDREVYDIAWGGLGVFATVSADGRCAAGRCGWMPLRCGAASACGACQRRPVLTAAPCALVRGLPARAPTCGAETWRFDDGTNQTLITPQSMVRSCDGVNAITLVGRIIGQFQRGLTLQWYFGDPVSPSPPYAWMDGGVGNGPRGGPS